MFGFGKKKKSEDSKTNNCTNEAKNCNNSAKNCSAKSTSAVKNCSRATVKKK